VLQAVLKRAMGFGAHQEQRLRHWRRRLSEVGGESGSAQLQLVLARLASEQGWSGVRRRRRGARAEAAQAPSLCWQGGALPGEWGPQERALAEAASVDRHGAILSSSAPQPSSVNA